MVYAENPETGEKGIKRVVQTFENETTEFVHVHVNGEEIITTPGHPFYVPQKGWTQAIDLRAGDILVLVNGEYVTVEKTEHELLESPVKVYNFEVEDYHTYYVSDSGVLVHNSCNHNSKWDSERRRYWKQEGKRYQDKLLENANLEDNLSESGLYFLNKDNIDSMLKGKAPTGTDGLPINLHHNKGIASDFFDYTEMLATEHRKNFKALHYFLYNK